MSTVANSQVYSNDEFDLWPIYSGERFRAFRPSCLYAVLASKIILPRHVTDRLQCLSLDTRHGVAVVNFNGFLLLFIYCTLVIS